MATFDNLDRDLVNKNVNNFVNNLVYANFLL